MSKDYDDEWYISRRIAAPDAEYPVSEAQYATIEQYLADRYDDVDFFDEVLGG